MRLFLFSPGMETPLHQPMCLCPPTAGVQFTYAELQNNTRT